MSIEFCLYDEVGEYDHTLVEPGDGSFIPNFVDGERQIIGISCSVLDESGTVSIYPPEAGFEDPETLYVDCVDVPKPISKIVVDENRPHDQKVVTEDGTMVNLRIRLVSSTAITSAMQIPLGLMYPDRQVALIRIEKD